MFNIYYYRNNETNITTMSDLRGACIVAYNEVRLGCDCAEVVDCETGEVLRTYIKGC